MCIRDRLSICHVSAGSTQQNTLSVVQSSKLLWVLKFQVIIDAAPLTRTTTRSQVTTGRESINPVKGMKVLNQVSPYHCSSQPASSQPNQEDWTTHYQQVELWHDQGLQGISHFHNEVSEVEMNNTMVDNGGITDLIGVDVDEQDMAGISRLNTWCNF